tara:strand:- start:1185 stop:1733 length:549 start_codon:yes stop_codon:yes gene_type:complete
MHINKTWKLEKIIPKKDNTRFCTRFALIEDGNLVATNGKAMVVHPIELTAEDHDGFVTIEAIKASRKNGGLIGANSALTVAGTVYLRPDIERDQYPSWKNVVPDYDAEGETKVECISFGIDAALLRDVADALGATGNASKSQKCISLQVPVDRETGEVTRPIVVTCADSEGSKGLIMPLTKL